jgi:predicted restriction endonuclease
MLPVGMCAARATVCMCLLLQNRKTLTRVLLWRCQVCGCRTIRA